MAECVACTRPVPDVAYVCASCAGTTGRRLREAAELWPEIATTIARQTRMGDPVPRRGRPAPAEAVDPDGHGSDADCQVRGWPSGLVVDLAAAEARDAAVNTLTTWARTIADQKWTWPPPVGPWCLECDHASCVAIYGWWRDYNREMPPPTRLGELTRWVADRLDWARYQRWADEALDELGEVPRLLSRAVDRPIERVDAGLCWLPLPDGTGDCQERLSAPPGAASLHCRGCGARHDVHDRHRTLLRAARDHRGSATEVARWLTWLGVPTTPAAVRGLARRSRVLPDGHGRYRLGDVEQVRTEQLERERRVAA